MLSVVLIKVVKLSGTMLGVAMLNVVILIVMAPSYRHKRVSISDFLFKAE